MIYHWVVATQICTHGSTEKVYYSDFLNIFINHIKRCWSSFLIKFDQDNIWSGQLAVFLLGETKKENTAFAYEKSVASMQPVWLSKKCCITIALTTITGCSSHIEWKSKVLVRYKTFSMLYNSHIRSIWIKVSMK